MDDEKNIVPLLIGTRGKCSPNHGKIVSLNPDKARVMRQEGKIGKDSMTLSPVNHTKGLFVLQC